MFSMFRKMPIRTKLVMANFVVATLVSVGGFLIIIYTDIGKLRADAIKMAQSDVAVISQDLVKVIVFGRAEDAADVVTKLESLPRVQASYVYNPEGELVFGYQQDGTQQLTPPKLQADGARLNPLSIDLYHPVAYQGTRYGTIYMSLSTEELVAREQDYYRLVAAVVMIFILLFLIAGYWIPRFFSRPILELSKSVDQIATEQDYSKRLFTAHQDEVGVLYRSFNQLLEVIESSQDSLEQNMARTDGILNVVGNVIISIDSDYSIILFNHQAEKSFGYRSDEVMGRSLDMLIPERFRHSHSSMVRDFGEESAAMRPAMQRDYISALRKDGTEFPIEASISRMDFDDSVIYTVALNDITMRLHTEDELKRYRLHLEDLVNERTHELKRANKEMEAFSYSVSHDLRAPLRRIDGFSKVLLEDHMSQLDADGQNYLNRIRASTQRMSVLIDDMLNLSRISRKEMKILETDLSDMARTVATHLRESDTQRSVDFIIQDTPPVECDPGLMQIVLENLLQNAWNYSVREDQAVIEFSHQMNAEGLTVYTLRDNGAGFDMKYASKLFGVFERLHEDKDFVGTGIGLATVFRIIERHGGRIWAEGEVNQGAVFNFSLGQQVE